MEMLLQLLVIFLTVISRVCVAQAVLPFFELSSESASVFTGVDDNAVRVEFPMPFYFSNTPYDEAFISSNGLISFGERYTAYRPRNFPLNIGQISVISPYWDDIDLRNQGNIFYESYDIAAGDGSGSNNDVLVTISDFITESENLAEDFICTSAVVVYWSNVCPFGNDSCGLNTNSFQAVLASNSMGTSYAVFTYKCGLLRWTNHLAAIGYSAREGEEFYSNHYLSRQSNVNDIACLNDPDSPWSNVVYRVDKNIPSCTSECNLRSDELEYDACCDPGNFGNFVKVFASGIHRGYLVCPRTAPDWCV